MSPMNRDGDPTSDYCRFFAACPGHKGQGPVVQKGDGFHVVLMKTATFFACL